MTDLIARLTERRRLHDRHKEVNDQCTETMSLADFDLCLHALKVTKAAEEWHRCVKKGDGPAALKAYDALVAAVKGEQG